MNQPHQDPDIRPEFIEALTAELFRSAVTGAPPTVNRFEFGKDMAQQVLMEAWKWLIKGKNQTAEDLRRTAFHLLGYRLNDEYRKTENRQRTDSIQALDEIGGVDSLAHLMVDEPLPDEVLNRADWAALVNEALGKLSNPYHRKVLELRHWHEMDNGQIAQALGICTRTVIRWYQEAENAFRTALRTLTDDTT